uniref:Uncharacterized protein n=1 Tax=Anguilla anguilla TaxID=7936 RepID=A0A0E9ULY7_ANGAN
MTLISLFRCYIHYLSFPARCRILMLVFWRPYFYGSNMVIFILYLLFGLPIRSEHVYPFKRISILSRCPVSDLFFLFRSDTFSDAYLYYFPVYTFEKFSMLLAVQVKSGHTGLNMA